MAYKRLIEITCESTTEKVVVDNLYISFEIDKNNSTTPNKAQLKIYNLSDDTANKFKAKNKLTIAAGYRDEGGAVALFYGDINKATSFKEGTEKILSVEAFDGLKNTLEKNIVLSYGENTNDKTIYDEIIKNLGLPVAGTPPTLTGVYAGGYAFIGKTKNALTAVLKKNKYKWTVQNAQLYIFKEGAVADSSQELNLSYDTGLLKIEPMDQDLTLDGSQKTLKGKYRITALLFPQLIPGASVSVSTEKIAGRFNILNSVYAGDNFGGDFHVVCETEALT